MNYTVTGVLQNIGVGALESTDTDPCLRSDAFNRLFVSDFNNWIRLEDYRYEYLQVHY